MQPFEGIMRSISKGLHLQVTFSSHKVIMSFTSYLLKRKTKGLLGQCTVAAMNAISNQKEPKPKRREMMSNTFQRFRQSKGSVEHLLVHSTTHIEAMN